MFQYGVSQSLYIETANIDCFASKVDVFPDFFRRVLAMTSVTSLSFTTRRLLLAFVVHAFQSLDVGFVKKELATLAQIHIWAGLSSDERRNVEFERHPQLRKFWKGSVKRFEAAGTHLVGRALTHRQSNARAVTVRAVLAVQYNYRFHFNSQ